MRCYQTPQERIKQRRLQMLIHSYLYYVLDESTVSDYQWQAWANELAQLQKEHGHAIGFYDDEFADWRGDTGMHLPQDDWIAEKAHRVLRLHESQRKDTK